MLPQFELLMPQTLPEALEMLTAHAPDALPIAGGTNLIPDLRGGKRGHGVLVNVAGLDGLEGVGRQDHYIVIGSGVTVAALLESELIAEHAPILREAAAVFANPLIRNRATVGGNLGHASPAADTAPPLLALNAEVRLKASSAEDSRWVPLQDFFLGVCDTVCRPAELITAVRWPVPPPRTFGRFHKLSLRRSTAVSVVSVAVQATFNDAGRCAEVAIALGAVAPTPIRVPHAEEVLRGEVLTPDVIQEATGFACTAASCIGDVRSSAAYRERVTDVLMRRLLVEAQKWSEVQ